MKKLFLSNFPPGMTLLALALVALYIIEPMTVSASAAVPPAIPITLAVALAVVAVLLFVGTLILLSISTESVPDDSGGGSPDRYCVDDTNDGDAGRRGRFRGLLSTWWMTAATALAQQRNAPAGVTAT